MEQRIAISGYITVPARAPLPEIGQIVSVGSVRAEVVTEEVAKREKDGAVELVHTRKTKLLEGAKIVKVDEPEAPLFDGAAD